MKKLLTLVLALLMIATLPVYAETETTEEIEIEYQTIEGIVTEITETYFITDTTDLGEVQVNYDENTFFSEEIPFACGQYAFVTYGGMMTRSLPPQIYAEAVMVSRMIGSVVFADEEANTITIMTNLHGEVIVHLMETDSALNYAEGDLVMVYNSGAMAMSLPPQIGGSLIMHLYTVTGSVIEIGEGYVVIDENGAIYQVNFAPDTAMTANSAEMKVGDSMTVLFNGMMTRSIPAQITAIELTVNTVSSEE